MAMLQNIIESVSRALPAKTRIASILVHYRRSMKAGHHEDARDQLASK